MDDAVLVAAESAMHGAGLKPKNVAETLETLEKEYGVTASVSNGFLKLEHNTGTSVTNIELGAAFGRLIEKHPRTFYGLGGQISFKKELADDLPAKMKFIDENGIDAWESLPYDEKDLRAKHVIGKAIPSAYMTKKDYLTLSLEEKVKLSGQIGHKGVAAIMARTK
jgi:hypothetical protein